MSFYTRWILTAFLFWTVANIKKTNIWKNINPVGLSLLSSIWDSVQRFNLLWISWKLVVWVVFVTTLAQAFSFFKAVKTKNPIEKNRQTTWHSTQKKEITMVNKTWKHVQLRQRMQAVIFFTCQISKFDGEKKKTHSYIFHRSLNSFLHGNIY